MQRYENHWHELAKEDTGRFVLCSEAMEKIEKKDMDIERLDALAFERLQIIAEQAQQIATLKAENEKLKGEAMAWEKAFNIEWERLERLTTLINDDEKANEVATEHGEMPSATSTLNGQSPDSIRSRLKASPFECR